MSQRKQRYKDKAVSESTNKNFPQEIKQFTSVYSVCSHKSFLRNENEWVTRNNFKIIKVHNISNKNVIELWQ